MPIEEHDNKFDQEENQARSSSGCNCNCNSNGGEERKRLARVEMESILAQLKDLPTRLERVLGRNC
jgi:hypothetical protein